ncbi:hypothetical protein [Streptomyces sp. RTGN2]|uniref:hypothetical protein n=1 Tax=unclassified Streptomyces TaxID=2593676 RepID=UPI002554DADF|nr:hypothetical protein [Streptomyces sp. RTGN2]
MCQEYAGADDEQAVTDAGDKAAAGARPKPKAQANFTDPESRIRRVSATARGGEREGRSSELVPPGAFGKARM